MSNTLRLNGHHALVTGPVAILVNNAGQAESAPFLETSLELWQRMLAVNLTGSFVCVQPAEVADAVAWLCGDDAAAITGQSISVSGGEIM